MHQQDASNRKIADCLCLNRSTVNDYFTKLKAYNLNLTELLSLPEPVLESKFKLGTAAYKETRFEDFKALIPYFEKELSRKHVTSKILWEEYLSTHTNGYRYTQFCFHLDQMLVARKPVAILEHAPGEKLYIDFARHSAQSQARR